MPSHVLTGHSLPLTQVLTGHTAAPLSLSVIKGYLLSASPLLLAAHNLTGLYAKNKEDPTAVYVRTLSLILTLISRTF